MAVVVSGNVAASIPSAGVVTLTFTDTSTGVGTLVSRTLVITNANGVIVDTINMGSVLTADYDISADQYLTFTETIIDNTGTYTLIVNYISTSFFEYAFANAIASITSENDTYGTIYNLSRADDYKMAAETYGLYGIGVTANALIVQANFYVNTPYYA